MSYKLNEKEKEEQNNEKKIKKKQNKKKTKHINRTCKREIEIDKKKKMMKNQPDEIRTNFSGMIGILLI